jgi:anti-sigma regulatory factor (Ser/Thr protein kinase)
MAPSFARGHAEQRCSGPVPSRPVHPRPPTPWKGRSADCALDLDRANAAPGSYVEVPAFGPTPLARGRSQPNPEQARRSNFRADHARALLLVAALARPRYLLGVSGRYSRMPDTHQIPTLRGCWLARVSPTRGGEEPGCTIRKEAASGRGSGVELTISASPFELAGLRRAARDALGEVPTQVADELLLALDEAATNAILHGSGGGDPIQVAVRVGDAWVEASVLDHGPAEPPRPVSTSDRLSGGGWGLWLLRCLVDEVRLERVEGGTRVTLRRRIRPRSAVTGVG